MKWTRENKGIIWAHLIHEKIMNQSRLLQELDISGSEKLKQYAEQVVPGDKTNREAHAAKVYFNALFGHDFSRHKESLTNVALNYGYAILLSAINREVTVLGCLTQLGIFHDNVFNQFNLSSDLIEPLRSLIDKEVWSWGAIGEFNSAHKMSLVDILNKEVRISKKNLRFIQALEIYCRSVIEALNENNYKLIQCIEYE
jgi:CRISPR-associated endonuclease Cas1 subtype II